MVVPDGRGAVASPARFAAHAIAAGGAVDGADVVDVVVGHSGAGTVLPVVAAACGGTAVYVDALVPPVDPSSAQDVPLRALLDRLPIEDGLLPPWADWWPPEVIADLVPDASVRRGIVDELPRVPRRFYDRPADLPPAWWERPAAYLQLSPAYDAERTRAESLGWPTAHLPGRHLDLVVHPEAVASAVRRLVAAVTER